MAKQSFFVIWGEDWLREFGNRDEAERHVLDIIEGEGANQDDITVIHGNKCVMTVIEPVEGKVTLSG